MITTGSALGQQAFAQVEAYIRGNGGNYRTWYVGIAANPRQRLFIDHSVAEQGTGPWIFRDCGTDDAARLVERYFLTMGCKGGGGGGDRTTRFVYAYVITPTTRE